MLPRPDAPARRLPYTTADMGERLAKRKAEQEAAAQAKANQALRFGVTNPPAVKKDEPWYKDALGAVGGAIKSAYEWLPNEMPSTTPINMGGNAGVSMGGQGTAKSMVAEPARLAVRRAVGDITAIPHVGADSPSYTADQIRKQGVAKGVLGAAIDYSQFIPVVAKGAGFTSDAVNAYKLAMMERQANPFPALRGATNVIDVVEGSRLPARVVESPASPATRLAEAQTQRALPPAVQRALPAANVSKPGMVIPDSLAGIRDLPTLPSRLNFTEFQSMPEYQQYLEAGQRLPTIQELEQFGFDPERAYMVHGGPGTLQNDVLNPNFSGARDVASKNLNAALREKVVANYREADSIVNGLGNGLKAFEQTGIWNGPQILNDMTNLMNKDASRVLPVNELGLNQIINVGQMPNKNFFVEKIRNMINSYQKTVNELGPTAKLAQEGDYLSVYPATVGTFRGAVAPIDGATYLASSPTEQVSQYMSFNNGGGFGVPEYQMFGQHSPLASINYGNLGSSLSTEDLAAARAFFLRKVIEDRIARGLYEQPIAPTTPATPATRLGQALAQMTLDARAAQGGVRDAGVIRFPGGEPTPEIVQPPESKALLQRLRTRNDLGVTVRDIEFPPKNSQKADWYELGDLQINAGINAQQLPEHIKAVSKYFDEQYMAFHDYLRTDTITTDTIENDVALIDQLFDIVPPVTSPITLYRGVISDEYIGNIYKNLQPGQIVYDPNYLSTSVSEVKARNWIRNLPANHLLIIDAIPGTKAINSKVANTFYGRSELEMLLPRSLPLRVKSIDGNVIYLETLPYEYIDNAKDLSDLFENKNTNSIDIPYAANALQAVRIAEFIRQNVDPNNPLLKYYLDQYGSIENFANSNESFNMMSFMRPFFGKEPLSK